MNNGTGLANVAIYLSLAAYAGEIIATTDSNGDFQSEFKNIPGDENLTIWAELEGYTFDPPDYRWRHYHGLEVRTVDYSAAESTSTPYYRPGSVGNEDLPGMDWHASVREATSQRASLA